MSFSPRCQTTETLGTMSKSLHMALEFTRFVKRYLLGNYSSMILNRFFSFFVAFSSYADKKKYIFYIMGFPCMLQRLVNK